MEEQEIERIMAEFSGLIIEYTIQKSVSKHGKENTDVKILFKNRSKMKAFFVVAKTKLKDGYSFQWMNPDNTLIIRWDNTPNHLDVGLHHKHLGANDNVQPSEEMTLRKVLSFIAKALGFAG